MNNAINELVRSIVKKNSLAECSVSELQRLTTQYPYFGPVQFLLARKLKEENSSQYAKQSQKAILYFQDDLWFDYVTSSRLNEVVFSKNKVQAESLPVQPLMATKETTAETVEKIEAVSEPVTNEMVVVEEEVVEGELVEPVIEPEEQISASVQEIQLGLVEPAGETAIEEVKQSEEISETSQPVIHEKAPVEYDDGSSYTPQPEIKLVEEEKEQQVEPMASEEENSEEEEITPVNTDLPPLPAFKIEPFNPETAKLSFEPYHTVDYFASQGIKFREEEKPKDKFSQQLKSFTEWLKTLKKVPETTGGSAPTATGPEDKKVTQLAAHSLAEDAVVTEAMADVWEKQGNHEKAIETYRKLSLLNPSKSAYFAAKIDHLKQL
jgi:tetratricopeptide (TPR) repeat protein